MRSSPPLAGATTNFRPQTLFTFLTKIEAPQQIGQQQRPRSGPNWGRTKLDEKVGVGGWWRRQSKCVLSEEEDALYKMHMNVGNIQQKKKSFWLWLWSIAHNHSQEFLFWQVIGQKKNYRLRNILKSRKKISCQNFQKSARNSVTNCDQTICRSQFLVKKIIYFVVCGSPGFSMVKNFLWFHFGWYYCNEILPRLYNYFRDLRSRTGNIKARPLKIDHPRKLNSNVKTYIMKLMFKIIKYIIKKYKVSKMSPNHCIQKYNLEIINIQIQCYVRYVLIH